VYVTGRRKSELDAAVAPLGPNAVAVQGDVSKPADLDRLYNQIRQEVGHVDVVFANAGIGGLAPLGSLTEAHVDALLDIIRKSPQAMPLAGAPLSIRTFARAGMKRPAQVTLRPCPEASNDLRAGVRSAVRVGPVGPRRYPHTGHSRVVMTRNGRSECPKCFRGPL
jgi:NAD(P)-dependent dehydrogenase (short-subunit alcohol dehydrogenase family)